MTDTPRTHLSSVVQKFILHWGEMGTKWGINRTVAQIHALLFLSAVPLTADKIAETLSVARSNVSTSLRELQGWRIVRGVSVFGDRRQHFESMKDLWEMFRVISEERKRREFDPTVAVVRECVAEAKKAGCCGRARARADGRAAGIHRDDEPTSVRRAAHAFTRDDQRNG